MKSVFERIKEEICQRIMKKDTIDGLKEELKYILEEYDLEDDEED